MTRIVIGALIMIVALGVQLAMVTRLVAPSLPLALTGYGALFAGMFVALFGLLGQRYRP